MRRPDRALRDMLECNRCTERAAIAAAPSGASGGGRPAGELADGRKVMDLVTGEQGVILGRRSIHILNPVARGEAD